MGVKYRSVQFLLLLTGEAMCTCSKYSLNFLLASMKIKLHVLASMQIELHVLLSLKFTYSLNVLVTPFWNQQSPSNSVNVSSDVN